ncbi:MAG: hypothetical protein R3D60_02310 [Paracoccaceae bacterium]
MFPHARAAFAATLFAVLPLALPALGDTPMDAEAFDRYTQGRTLSYHHLGQPYGIEQYLPGRRVRWAFIGNICQEGIWYERNGMICFLYDDAPTNEQCWIFHETETGMRGVAQGPEGPSTELYEVEQSDRPLNCAGPDVGV